MIHQAAGTAVVTAQDDPCASSREESVPPPRFEYPRPNRNLDYEGDYLFKVYPVPGATQYLWDLVQGGAVRQEVYRREADQRVEGPADLVRGYLRYLGFLWEANHEERTGVPVGVNGREPVTAYAVLRESEEHMRFSPGELQVIVRADVCGVWSEPAELTVHLTPRFG